MEYKEYNWEHIKICVFMRILSIYAYNTRNTIYIYIYSLLSNSTPDPQLSNSSHELLPLIESLVAMPSCCDCSGRQRGVNCP